MSEVDEKVRDFLQALADEAPSAVDVPPGALRRARMAASLSLAGAGAALVVVAVGAFLGLQALRAIRGPEPGTVPTPGQDERAYKFGQCEFAPGLGTTELGAVAYVRDDALHVVDVATGEDRILVERGVQADESMPVGWSPDGRWISFGPGRLVPAAGGRPCQPLGVDLFGLTWSPTEALFVAKTADGALVAGVSGGPETELLPPGSGVGSFAFDPSGRYVAAGFFQREGERVKAAGIVLFDLQTGGKREVVGYGPEEGIDPRVATWSPDGQWILYWDTFGLSASLSADGGPLKAIPVLGGEPVTVVDGMLFYRDFLTWCGNTLVVAAGGGRSVTEGKGLVAAQPPGWDADPLRERPEVSAFWPDCAPDRWVAATVSESSPEAEFGTLPRRVDFFPLSDPTYPGGWSLPRMSAEFPQWSVNHPGEIVILFVGREPAPEGPATLYLQDGKATREVADLGPVGSYYGRYDYASRFSWHQP